MILYNVTVKVDINHADEWVKWMKEEHILDLMETGLFKDAKLYRLLEVDETDGITYSAQYFCKDMEAYNRYIDEYADEMRRRGLERFEGKFVAFRSLLDTVDK